MSVSGGCMGFPAHPRTPLNGRPFSVTPGRIEKYLGIGQPPGRAVRHVRATWRSSLTPTLATTCSRRSVVVPKRAVVEPSRNGSSDRGGEPEGWCREDHHHGGSGGLVGRAGTQGARC